MYEVLAVVRDITDVHDLIEEVDLPPSTYYSYCDNYDVVWHFNSFEEGLEFHNIIESQRSVELVGLSDIVEMVV